MTKHYVDSQGKWIDGYSMLLVDGEEPDHLDVPDGAIEVPNAPDDVRQAWNGSEWSAAPLPEPDPDDELDEAIRGSSNFQELKSALLGRTRGRKT